VAKYDELIKSIAKLRPNDFVQWVCPRFQKISNISCEDREFAFTHRRVDTLYKVQSQEVGTFYVHLEFQVGLRKDFPLRLQEYSARMHREFKTPVKTVVIFLNCTKAIEKLVTVNRFELAGELISEFRYTKIILPKEYWKDIVNKGFPALLPLVSFTKIPLGEEREALGKAAEGIETIPNPELRGELGAALYLLGGYKYSGVIKEVIRRKLMQELMESKTYQEMAEAVKVESKLEYLLKVLETRFTQKLPKKLQKQLKDIQSLEKLDRLFELAIKSASIAEFAAEVKD
jgi:predicted transposase YdaD